MPTSRSPYIYIYIDVDLKPDIATYNIMMMNMGMRPASEVTTEEIERIFFEIYHNGLKPNIVVFNNMFDILSRRKEYEKVVRA